MATFPHFVKLNNGTRMPIIGLGTWQSTPGEVQMAVEHALDSGYRHIDTAYGYGNENEIGDALKKQLDSGKLKREDVFICTKLPNQGHLRPKHYLQKSLDKLQLSFIDLYLIHFPMACRGEEEEFWPRKDGKIIEETDATIENTWKDMEKLVDLGLTKAIGVSNFNSAQIERICKIARIQPSNVQVECHAYFQQKKLFEFCKERNITLTAYAPLGSPSSKTFLSNKFGVDVKDFPDILNEPSIVPIAKKYNKSSAQIYLRWFTQRGVAVVPKSVTPKRILENFQIFDFTLTDDEMNMVNSLDKDSRVFDFSFIGNVKEMKEYPFHIAF